ncbi:Kelch repeat-containing protein [Parvibaculum sp.]|uniref:Kelch repeat-containing protein n=1 Tax=Parvibaculum sp. TaxID=2024848 RepID=UPI002FDA677C
MTTGRAFAGGALIGNELYVIGGDSTAGPRTVAEIYDIRGDIWRAAPALPAGLQQFGVAEYGGKLYVSGGYEAPPAQRPEFGTFGAEGAADASEEEGDTARTWSYDPRVGTWISLAAMPGARAGHGFIAVGDRIYALSGRGGGASRVWVYDPIENDWSATGDAMPSPRVSAAYVEVDGRIYVIGGLVNGVATDQVDIFDPASGRWQSGPRLPSPRSGHVAALVDGRIHVTGGELRRPPRTYGDHFVLDLASGSWSKAAPMPTPRHGAVAAASGDKFVVVGGSPGAGVYTVFTESDVVDIYSTE